MSWSVTIGGFKNSEDAKQFLSWYSHQGEQYIDDWMQCRKQEGLDVRSSHLLDFGNQLVDDLSQVVSVSLRPEV